MKLLKVFTLFGLALAASAQVAMAQPSVVVEDAVVPSGTATVDIDVTFTPDAGNTATAVFEVMFSDAELSLDDISGCAPVAQFACSNPGPGVVRWAATPDFGGNLPGFTGVITFSLAGATEDVTYPLVVQNEDYLDPGAMPLPPSGTMDGSILVESVPMPALGSSPQNPGETINFGIHATADPNADSVLSITNVGAGDGGTLTGECSISNSAGGVFTLAGSPVALSLDVGDPATDLTLTCNTSTLGVYNGELECTHNGSNAPSTWPLLCEVAPVPEYDSTPAPGNPLAALNGVQGNTNPTTTLAIDNVGQAGSTLTGTCTLTGPDAEITVSGGAFSLLDTDTPAMVTVACDTTAAGSYTNTLSCGHNDADGDPANPATYAVSCEIGPPDPAVYASSPYAPGDPIDVNEGAEPPPAGGPTPSTVLTISNAAQAGDDLLDLLGCDYSGDPQITASPTPVNDDLAPGDSVAVTFSCSTAAEGMFSGTYSCPFDTNPSAPDEGVISPAEYPVECEVRAPESAVITSPPGNETQTAELMPGDSHVFTFTFIETIDEGLDASLDDCTLSTGTDFAITDPGSFPQPIPSGGSETVDVTFTDPGVGDTFTDTLTCAYTENPEIIIEDPEGGVEVFVSWPLEVTVTGRNVTFLVTKDFDDDNPAGVEVSLSCNTGLPLEQTGTVHDPDAVGLGPGEFTELNFVMVDFEPGTMDCDISEVVPAGYEAGYFADVGEDGVAADWGVNEDGCFYEGLESADFICEITNTLQPVEVTVNKEWIDEHPEYNLPTAVEVTLTCNAEVFNFFQMASPVANGLNGGPTDSAEQYIDPNNPGLFGVFPHWDGSTECFVTEEVDAGILPDLTDCESIPLAPGVDGECTIVNTRLFAGIPTLSQYGLMLMALLMLGVGALAFRRYV